MGACRNETLIGALRSNGLTLFLYLFTLGNSLASFRHIQPVLRPVSSIPTLDCSALITQPVADAMCLAYGHTNAKTNAKPKLANKLSWATNCPCQSV